MFLVGITAAKAGAGNSKMPETPRWCFWESERRDAAVMLAARDCSRLPMKRFFWCGKMALKNLDFLQLTGLSPVEACSSEQNFCPKHAVIEGASAKAAEYEESRCFHEP